MLTQDMWQSELNSSKLIYKRIQLKSSNLFAQSRSKSATTLLFRNSDLDSEFKAFSAYYYFLKYLGHNVNTPNNELTIFSLLFLLVVLLGTHLVVVSSLLKSIKKFN